VIHNVRYSEVVTPVIDWAKLLERWGNVEIIKEAMPLYLVTTQEHLDQLAEAKQGIFANDPGFDLRIIPEDNHIVLDFSSRGK